MDILRLRAPNPWRELTWLSLLGMELSWIFPWFLLMIYSNQGTSWPGALLFLAVVLAGANLLERLFSALDIKKNVRTWFLAGTLLISILAGLKLLVYAHSSMTMVAMLNSVGSSLDSTDPWFPAGFVVIVLTMLVVFRGVRLADGGIEPATVMGGFRRSIVMLLFWSLLASVASKGIEGFWIYLGSFLLFSLIGMSTSRFFQVSSTEGGQRTPFDRKRIAGISAAILALVVLSSLAALLLSSRQGFQLLMALVASLGAAVQAVIILITLLLLPVLYLILQLISALFSGRMGTAKLNLPDTSQLVEQWVKADPGSSPSSVQWMRPVLLWGVIIMVAIVVLYVYRYQVRKKHSTTEVELDSLVQDEDLLNMLLKNLRKNAQQAADRLLGRFLTAGRVKAAEQIRRIYSELLDLTSQLNAPRPLSATPLEYLPRLASVFPNRFEDLSLITRAYLKVRYGQLPESAQEVQAVETAWSRIRTDGKQLLAAQGRK